VGVKGVIGGRVEMELRKREWENMGGAENKGRRREGWGGRGEGMKRG